MYKSIVEFAELERFMDQKLKNYSSGMQVRLAFSIAIRANTEILILDEVLAVGDSNFQEKCFEFFDKIKGKRTVVFVSHDMKSVKKYCDRALVLEKSKIIDTGSAEDMALRYSTVMANEDLQVSKAVKGKGVHVGSGDVKIEKVELFGSKNKTEAVDSIQPGEPFKIRINFTAKKHIKNPGLLMSVFTQQGTKLFSTNTQVDGVKVPDIKGKGYVELDVRENPFAPGAYKVNVGIFDEKIFYAYDHFRDALDFSVRGDREGDSNLRLRKSWTIISDAKK
jgi:ABC-type multidrug transport system ATPase subunit